MFLTCFSAEILETDAEPVAYLIANNPAYTNPTGLGEPLQPRRDIHPIAEDVVRFSQPGRRIPPPLASEMTVTLTSGG